MLLTENNGGTGVTSGISLNRGAPAMGAVPIFESFPVPLPNEPAKLIAGGRGRSEILLIFGPSIGSAGTNGTAFSLGSILLSFSF